MIKPRYSRIAEVALIGPSGLRTLRRCRMAILGAGNLGGELVRHAGMLDFESILLIDRDVVSEANLGNQGFAASHKGLPKVQARAASITAVNPMCRIQPVHADIEHIGLGLLRGVDLVFSALDSRRARVVANELAARVGAAFVDGAMDGSGRLQFGRVAAYHAQRTACYLCAYDAKGLAEIQSEGAVENCRTALAWNSVTEAPPTIALSSMGSVVASVQFLWALKILLGRGDDVLGREMYFDLDQNVMSVQGLERNPQCLFDHRSFRLTHVVRPMNTVTVEETFRMAEARLTGTVTLEPHRRAIATELRCPSCGAERQPLRVLETLAEREAQCSCGSVMQPVASGLLSRFSRDQAVMFLNETWSRIGLPALSVVTASNGKAEVHFVLE